MNVATTIVRQIRWDVKAALGYSNPAQCHRAGREEGLTFKARVLPFTKTGKRGTGARVMRVSIYLNGLDYYDVEVGWLRGTEWVTHYSGTNVDAFSLNRVLLSLDYDGPTVRNPRYA